MLHSEYVASCTKTAMQLMIIKLDGNLLASYWFYGNFMECHVNPKGILGYRYPSWLAK